MSKPQTLQELKSELASLESQLKGMNQLAKKRTRIAALIRHWEDIFEDDKKPAKSRPTTTLPKATHREGTTADFAYTVLQLTGPESIGTLVQNMREAGWIGSGDDATDRKRVYSALYARGKSKRFSLDNGKWSLLVEQAKAS